jgi:hypothetical protein
MKRTFSFFFTKNEAIAEWNKDNTKILIGTQLKADSLAMSFLVLAVDEFITTYVEMKPHYRHHHEYVQGHCKLYFDLDGHQSVIDQKEDFLTELNSLCKAYIPGFRDNEPCLILNGGLHKFSCHVIFHELWFESRAHLLFHVKTMMENASPILRTIVDLNVYTTGFLRLPYSEKIGKNDYFHGHELNIDTLCKGLLTVCPMDSVKYSQYMSPKNVINMFPLVPTIATPIQVGFQEFQLRIFEWWRLTRGHLNVRKITTTTPGTWSIHLSEHVFCPLVGRKHRNNHMYLNAQYDESCRWLKMNLCCTDVTCRKQMPFEEDWTDIAFPQPLPVLRWDTFKPV